MTRRNEATVEIAAAADDIFKWITEPRRRMRWIRGLEESAETTDTGFTVGTGFLEVLVLDGRRYEMDVVVTALDPPRHLGQAILAHGGFTCEATWRLDERDGVTTVRFEQQTTFHHWLATLLGGPMTKATQAKLVNDLARLKNLVEMQ